MRFSGVFFTNRLLVGAIVLESGRKTKNTNLKKRD